MWMGALAAPILAVQAGRLFGGSGVAPASAVPAYSDDMPVTIQPAQPATPAQAAAVKWVREVSNPKALRNPFDVPEPPPVIPQAHVESPVKPAAEAPRPPGVPQFRVTGLIGSGAAGIASLDHALFKVGSDIGAGWTLTGVDSRERSITIRHADGREVVIHVGPG